MTQGNDSGQRPPAMQPLTIVLTQTACGYRYALGKKRGSIMGTNLQGKKVAILATDGFEQVELTGPKKALEEAGATVEVISPKDGEIKGWNMTDWGESVKVDKALHAAKPSDYAAPVRPGGPDNPGQAPHGPESGPVRE